MSVQRRWLLLILTVALVSRIVAAVGLQIWLDNQPNRQFLIEGDANGYWELGRRMAHGEPYELYSPPRRVLRMPGFPAVLAFSMRLPPGESFHVARIVLALVGTAGCFFVYLLGRQLVDERVGLIAAGLTAVSPTMVSFSVMILSETLFATCLTASLLLMAKLAEADSGASTRTRELLLAIGAGLACAAACYARPSWLLAAPGSAVLYVLLAKRRASALVSGAVVVATMFGALLLWAFRNERVTGHFVMTTLWVGPSLYDGLNPGATGDSEMSFYERDMPKLRTMTEYEIDRYYRRQAWEFVKDKPGRALELAAAKFWRFWKPWPNAPQFNNWSARLAVSTFFVPLLILAGIGLWNKRRDLWFCLFTAGPILYFTLLHMVFVSSLRYRLPAEYPLCIAAAVGLQTIVARRASKGSTPANL